MTGALCCNNQGAWFISLWWEGQCQPRSLKMIYGFSIRKGYQCQWRSETYIPAGLTSMMLTHPSYLVTLASHSNSHVIKYEIQWMGIVLPSVLALRKWENNWLGTLQDSNQGTWHWGKERNGQRINQKPKDGMEPFSPEHILALKTISLVGH